MESPPSQPRPFVNVATLVSQMHIELVPWAMHNVCDKLRLPGPAEQRAFARAFVRVEKMVTDDQLRVWLHWRASLRSWAAVHRAMMNLVQSLAAADQGDNRMRDVTAAIVGCPTVLNVTKLALRLALR